MNKKEFVGLMVVIATFMTTGLVGGMYVYQWGYENAVNEQATAYALEVDALNVQIVELNDTNTEYYDNIGFKQQKIDELTQEVVDLEALVSTAYPTALGDYTIMFRNLNETIGPYTYTTGTGSIRFLMSDEVIHSGPWTFIGEMNSIVIADLYDPDGNLIGVGGFFGEDLTLDISPLVKP